MKSKCLLGLLAFLGFAHGANAQVNSWTNTAATGFWQDVTKWSLLASPTNTHSAVFITNAASKTVTINSATPTGNLTISNLTVQGFGADINTLQLTNAGAVTPLRVLNVFTVGTNAVLLVSNSVVRADGPASASFIVDGSVTNLADGQIISTNQIEIGNTTTSRGNLTTLGGLLQVSNSVIVGVNGGAQGTLTISGGTNLLTGSLAAGFNGGATGTVWLTSGLLSNAITTIGFAGVGQMTVSNGTWLSAGQVDVSLGGGSQGTLTIAGGTNRLSTSLNIGSSANATGTVWITGSAAQLVVTNSSTEIGSSGVGQMILSNGTWLAQVVRVGNAGGSRGTLTMAGGTNILSHSLTIGSQLNAAGTVWLTGSAALLVATNFTTDIGGSGVGQMIVSNGTWRGIAARVGNLAGSQGTLTIAGGTNTLSFGLEIGSSANATGTVVLAGGNLWVTNAAGNAFLDVHSGALLLNAGTLSVDKLILTNGANSGFTFNGGALSSQSSYFTNGASPVIIGAVSNSATFNFQGTTHFLANGLTLGNTAGATGTVWMTGTQLVVTNGDTRVGFSGVGQMTMSNGTWLARRVEVGSTGGSQGTLTIAGGDCFIGGNLFLAFAATATGTVWVTGGQLTNDSIRIGQLNFGQMTVSNGTVSAKTVLVAGDNFGSRGVWTIAGGTNRVDTSLTLGNSTCTSTGTVILAGGRLLVTNSTGNAVLEVRSGTVTLDSGTLSIDNLVITNSCGRFLKTGGTLSITSTNLDPNLDADGDGFTNQQEANAGTSPFEVLPPAPTVTSWTNSSGRWETDANWSAGAPSSLFQAVLITNAATKTVTIDSATPAGNLTISNLTVQGVGAGINTLQLTNAPAVTLRILNGFTLGTNAVLTVTNTVLQVDGLLGDSFNVDGTVTNLVGGQILTASPLVIGSTPTGRGNLTTLGGLLQAGNNVTVGSLAGALGTLTLSGGTNELSTSLKVGDVAGATGAVWVTGGHLMVENEATLVGNAGIGRMTVSNGTWRAQNVVVGSSDDSQGTLTVAGGTNELSGFMGLGDSAGATGTVWVTGGQLTVTNDATIVGTAGIGRMTVSNGTWRTRNVSLGNFDGSRGTLTVAGGTNELSRYLSVGDSAGATGSVWVTGGQLTVTNNFTAVGNAGIGQMTVSNGTWRAREVFVGANPGSQGTLTVAGGVSSVYSNLVVGICGSATGIVNVAAGALYVTNSIGDAALDVRGTVNQSGGLLFVNRLVITNACGRINFTGGSLFTIAQILTPEFDADGDGIPNGADPGPLDATDTGNDPDGDGLTNLEEFQAGTNPTNSASFFGITNITQVDTNILITWQTGPGKTNALERTAGVAGSFATNDFAAIFTVTNTVGTVTNYLDIGAATNMPAFYYRVRLVQ